MQLSTTPRLYAYAHPCMTLNKAIAADILADYHLTVRIGNPGLFCYPRQMCIAGNRSVCELFIRCGHHPSTACVILSRNAWFCEIMPMDIKHMTGSSIREMILYMLKHKRHDEILKHFGNQKHRQLLPDQYDNVGMSRLAGAVVKTADVRIAEWLVGYNDYYVNYAIVEKIVKHDAVNLVPAVSRVSALISRVCLHGSIAMFTCAHQYSADTLGALSLETCIAYAFNSDNLTLFDHLVSIGASTQHLGFIEGIADGSFKCSLRIQPAHPNTHEIINAIAEHSNVSLATAMEHFQFTQDDFNHGVEIRVHNIDNPEEFLPYANNYDVDVYKQYGNVIMIPLPFHSA